jgi:putative ABC transport system substrate-binding protein
MKRWHATLVAIAASVILLIATTPARAQPPRGPFKIGVLGPGLSANATRQIAAFREGMRELGHIEGRTFVLESRFGDGHPDRLPALAAELVAGGVDVIVAISTPGALPAKAATRTIPIVFPASSDPVGVGVVSQLARPGGNVTGFSLMASELSGKRLQLLREVVPNITRVAVIWDASNPGMALRVRETRQAAEQIKVGFRDAGAKNLEELEASLADLLKQSPDALVVTTEPFTQTHRARILEFAAQNRVPAMYEERQYVEAGGLMSYGPNILDNYRRTAGYVDKILKGAKAGDLPIEQPTRFELVINQRTARALGLTLPPSMLLRADQVIE